jgi:hypothetical protein
LGYEPNELPDCSTPRYFKLFEVADLLLVRQLEAWPNELLLTDVGTPPRDISFLKLLKNTRFQHHGQGLNGLFVIVN